MPSIIRSFSSFDGDEQPLPERPEWIAPPPDVLGGLVPSAIPVVIGERVALILDRVQVYPRGLAFVVRGVVRGERGETRRPGPYFWEDRDSPDGLRVSAEFGDGRRAAFQPRLRPYSMEDPRAPALVLYREAGDDRSYEASYWISPAVVAPLMIALSWAKMVVPETSVVITRDQLETARAHIGTI